jgi:hypothetical protein
MLDVGNVTGLSACLKSGGGVCGGADNALHSKLKAEGSYRGAANGGFAAKSNLAMEFMRPERLKRVDVSKKKKNNLRGENEL